MKAEPEAAEADILPQALVPVEPQVKEVLPVVRAVGMTHMRSLL